MNLPPEFTSRMKAQLGDEYSEFLQSLDKPAPISIRINLAKKWQPEWTDMKEVPWSTEGYYLDNRPSFTLDPAFHAGAYYVQEASSMIIEYIFKKYAKKDSALKILDLCGAPGGKSTLLAAQLSDKDLLVSNEVIKKRVGILKENLTKWGFTNTIIANQDPETFSDLEGFFDVVLVDAPCSGEGLFRKNPEAINEWSLENLNTCSARQKRILSAAAMLVAPEGLLLYSTCTYNSNENSENTKWFTRTLDFEQIDIEVPSEWNISKVEGSLQFYPHKVKGEGFFISGFRNKGKDQKYVKGKPSMPRLPKKELQLLSNWIKNVEDFAFFRKNDGVVIALRESLLNEFGTVFKALQKRSSGIEIGIFKGTDFIPSHALALSSLVADNINRIELPKTDALLFLKKETFSLNEYKSGWNLVTYKGLHLGWVKIIGDRINNYLPADWRIRMDLES